MDQGRIEPDLDFVNKTIKEKVNSMPLLRFDLIEGRDEQALNLVCLI